MYKKIDLSGIWSFQPDEKKEGLKLPFTDTIALPGTTSHSKKGKKNEAAELGCLTEEYRFEGHAWFSRTVEITEDLSDANVYLFLERTRITTVWIDGRIAGKRNSLCTPHLYDITGLLSGGTHVFTILVDNTGYPTKGGHLTSPDTQTNWNGITGRIELQYFKKTHLQDVRLHPDVKNRAVTIEAKVTGDGVYGLSVSAQAFNSRTEHMVETMEFVADSGEIMLTYPLGGKALLWSEFEPNLYKLHLSLTSGGLVLDRYEAVFGLREFKASGDKFTINGNKTFLRGKHDGMIFPLTGFAPTTGEEWLKVMRISKSYGINHYRFHTCCPPEAAFEAADLLGIYMEPELPFWGTVTDESDEGHDPSEQAFLLSEGYAILDCFGNHPSFTMMSLGNELWGSRSRLDSILKGFKEYDGRILYTQGSNNFQFTPSILENDDFFCGVRFSKERLIRGSYAMCDAPLGHVQADMPCTLKDYDESIRPGQSMPGESDPNAAGGIIEIQYGTTTKKVTAEAREGQLIPEIPVVSHEIGQYAVFPDFREIGKYTGALKAKNFEIFRKRLKEKGLGDLAEKYFKCSGALAVECYKEELEAAFRSRKLAGFQILDIQDFTGQGTALVGILDAFMESKGLVSPEKWRSWCSDAVLTARFPKYNYLGGESFHAHIELCYYRSAYPDDFKLIWKLQDGDTMLENGRAVVSGAGGRNYIDLCDIDIKMPDTREMKKLLLSLNIEETGIAKTYDLWVYPKETHAGKEGAKIFETLSDAAMDLLDQGENVLLLPKPEKLKNSIEGFYCTDFWCYPMFRSISESMKKEVPVGTMGLLIDNRHPVFRFFPCEEYSTYPWWSIVSNSRSVILDDTPEEFRPIVQTIDNFERNHKLGLLFECRVSNGKLLVCTCDFEKVGAAPEGRQFLFSILKYSVSSDFNPRTRMEAGKLRKLME